MLCQSHNSPMSQEYEIVRYPKVRHIRVFVDEVKYRTQHLHGDYEFCFVLEGEATFHYLGGSLTVCAGDAAFLDSNAAHSIEGSMIGLFFQISNRFLASYLPELHSKSYRNCNLREYLGKRFEETYREALQIASTYFKEEGDYRAKSIDFCLRLLSLVFSSVPHEDLKQRDLDSRRKNAERLERIVSYIDAHHQGPLSLDEIASSEGITPTHLSHLFSEGLGVRYQDYLGEKRLETAVLLMRNSSKSIIDISYEAGFSDPKYMTRLFKKRYGCTPKEFRKANAAPEIYPHRDSVVLERIYGDQEAEDYLCGKFFSARPREI